MFNYVGYTCRLHACDMFDEMPIMDIRGPIKVLFNLLLLHHYFHVRLLLLSYHSILGSDLGSGPEKVSKILESLASNWQFWSTVAGRKAYESDFRLLFVPLPIAWDWIWPKRPKKKVGSRDRLYEWLTCPLRVQLMMFDVSMVCFCRFHFLKVTKEVESYHSGLSLHVYPSWLVS